MNVHSEVVRARPRLLLAEDSETARALTSALLRRLGCDVDAVENGAQALNAARQVRYDLILLDLDMPLMDGTAAAQAIRAQPSNRTTLIIAVSAFLSGIGDPDDRWRIFDSEIAKPMNLDRLRQVISAAAPTCSIEATPPVAGRVRGARRRHRAPWRIDRR